MSITKEFERLENAKASIKRAIENKDVIVGDGTIDTYASKIDEIKTSVAEDLTPELNEQNELISEQEVTIDDILDVLNNKMAGGTISLQEKFVLPTTNEQYVIPDSEYDGLSKVTVNAVTNDIDTNIKPENIKKNISILGIEGTLEEGINPSGTIEINENGEFDVTTYEKAKVSVVAEDRAKAIIEGTLTHLYDEGITTIRERVLGYNNALVEVNLPNVTKVSATGFASATALETVVLNSVETLVVGGSNDQQFHNCTKLKNVSMNNLKVVGGSSFQLCTSLKNIYLPSLTRVGANGFVSSGLETARFPVLTSIGAASFSGTKLTTLILENSVIATLDNINAFNNTPIAKGTGYIYVPQALLSDEDATKDYRRATNWSTYASQIRAIEDYPEICEEVF